jgi:hypothetical protein
MTSDVRVEVFQNEYLPEGGTAVNAVVTVSVGEGGVGVGAQPAAASAAEIIMIDCSGSMSGSKIHAARDAACVAIDALRDGVSFAVISGTHQASAVFPRHGLATASAETRNQAKAAVKRLDADGGTNFRTWLTLANKLFSNSRSEIKHAILLTDGANGDSAPAFRKVLDECAGKFVCDSRGVGHGWLARDLILVAETLLGTAAGMKDPGELRADFQSMMETAMGKTMADVALRLWTPSGATVRFVKQVFPEINDLTGRRVDTGPRVGEYPLGAWGAESRDYHLSIDIEANPIGEEMLAARVSVVHHDTVLAQGLVRAVWTDDLVASTKINKRVADVSGQVELADAIQEGLAARAAGDTEKATDRLGRAVKLAHETGNTDTAKLLAGVVDVVDAESGTVKLRKRSEAADVDINAEMAAVGSRKTRRVRPN